MTTPTLLPPKQLATVTVVADPGLDTKIPTEKAVRDAIASSGGGGKAASLVWIYQNFI